ncbi:MAG TPA: hypothetical protein VEG30_01105 [Terriglobales bacterium]|nr:hypothetical protein [Terriglobales bacterium]
MSIAVEPRARSRMIQPGLFAQPPVNRSMNNSNSSGPQPLFRRVIWSSVVSLALFGAGWVSAQIRGDAAQDVQIATLRQQVDEVNRRIETIRPANELVAQEQFNEFSRNVMSQLADIKAELVRQREWRDRRH